MTRTTPPRSADVAVVLPQLAPLARSATRLHPRPGSPTAGDSSIGGPLLWPADEPWPYCDGPHEQDVMFVEGRMTPKPATSVEDVRQERRITAAAANRSPDNPYFPPYTPEEEAALDRISPGRPWPRGPVAMLPVAQLSTRDIAGLRPPQQADVLQLLWCPFAHELEPYPRTALYWRTAADVTGVLAEPPGPAPAEDERYVPEPCVLDPEQVTEYPSFLELSKELREQVLRWCRQQSPGADVDDPFEPPLEDLYQRELSTAPGWKVGGWPTWGLTDPNPQYCPACGTKMSPLLTIASAEWDSSTRSWIPYEDQEHADPGACPDLSTPTRIRINDSNQLQLYTCPAFPDHPHTALVQ
jgi:hypothetical protein